MLERFKVLLPLARKPRRERFWREGFLEGRWTRVKIEMRQDRVTPVAIVKGS
jgi:hypothetical protein